MEKLLDLVDWFRRGVLRQRHNAEPGQTVLTVRGPYTLAVGERVRDGVLEGPGYAVELETDDLVYFMSPSAMGYGRSRKPPSP